MFTAVGGIGSTAFILGVSMDRPSMLLAAITMVTALFLVVGHRTGWIVTALTDLAPIRKDRGVRVFRRRESRWERIKGYRPRVGRKRRWW